MSFHSSDFLPLCRQAPPPSLPVLLTGASPSSLTSSISRHRLALPQLSVMHFEAAITSDLVTSIPVHSNSKPRNTLSHPPSPSLTNELHPTSDWAQLELQHKHLAYWRETCPHPLSPSLTKPPLHPPTPWFPLQCQILPLLPLISL